MHYRIRPFLGHLAYIVYGAAVGIASAVLWLYVILPGRALWLVGAAATACALLLIAATAAARAQRARQTRGRRRRAHARPRPHARRAV